MTTAIRDAIGTGIAYQIERRRTYAVIAQLRESACFLVKSANIFSLFFLYQKRRQYCRSNK
jgi:hypothetical protein